MDCCCNFGIKFKRDSGDNPASGQRTHSWYYAPMSARYINRDITDGLVGDGTSVCVNPSGVVCGTGTAGSNKIARVWSLEGVEIATYTVPSSLSVIQTTTVRPGPDGSFYIAVGGGLVKLSSAGALLGIVGTSSPLYGNDVFPYANHLFVKFNGDAWAYSPALGQIAFVNTPVNWALRSVCGSPDGTRMVLYYHVINGADRIRTYSWNGASFALLSDVSTGQVVHLDLAVDSSVNAYAISTELTLSRIRKFSMAGFVWEMTIPRSAIDPVRLWFLSGSLYLPGSNTPGKVAVYDTNGILTASHNWTNSVSSGATDAYPYGDTLLVSGTKASVTA